VADLEFLEEVTTRDFVDPTRTEGSGLTGKLYAFVNYRTWV